MDLGKAGLAMTSLLLLAVGVLVGTRVRSLHGRPPLSAQHVSHQDQPSCHLVCEKAEAASTAQEATAQAAVYDRVLVIPDLHGDYEQGLETLKLLGAIDADGKWVGGKALLIQLGDLADRGPNTLKLLDLFEDLKVQAEAAGGKVVTLLGNHSHMLATGQYMYFSRAELQELGGGDSTKAGLAKLKQLMEPGGKYGDLIRKRPVAWISTGTASRDCSMLMVHAAALPHMVKMARKWLQHQAKAERGGSPQAAAAPAHQAHRPHAHKGWEVVDAWNLGMAHAMAPSAATKHAESLEAMLTGDNGPIWSRAYVWESRAKVCADVAWVCEQLDVARIVVGHTVQASGQVSELCGGQLLMADVALSRAMTSRQLGDVMGLECRAKEEHPPDAGQGAGGSGEAEGGEGKGGGTRQGEVCSWVPREGLEAACEEAETKKGELRIWRNQGADFKQPIAHLLTNPNEP